MYKRPNAEFFKKFQSLVNEGGTLIIRTSVKTKKEDYMEGDTTDSNFVFGGKPFVFKQFDHASQMLVKCQEREDQKASPAYTYRTYILGT